MTLKRCRDCNAILNDRRSYPKGWDKELCEDCNYMYEVGLQTPIENFIKSIDFLWKNEALDGDETERIANIILWKLNEVNGNDN